MSKSFEDRLWKSLPDSDCYMLCQLPIHANMSEEESLAHYLSDSNHLLIRIIRSHGPEAIASSLFNALTSEKLYSLPTHGFMLALIAFDCPSQNLERLMKNGDDENIKSHILGMINADKIDLSVGSSREQLIQHERFLPFKNISSSMSLLLH